MSILENVVDIKNFGFLVDVDWTDIRQSTDYEAVRILPGDNVMDLAYRHYGTIDLWWCIYYFNSLSFPLNAITSNYKITKYLKETRKKLTEFDIQDLDTKRSLEEMMRDYFNSKGNDLHTSISLTKDLIKSKDNTIISSILTNIEADIVNIDMNLTTNKIKIPSMNIVYKMTSILSEYKRKTL